MRVEPDIARIAALFGEPSRAAILTTLFHGRALPAGELARIAGVSATAASGHLARLVRGKLIQVEREGRHRYYRLAGPAVATVIEDLAQLTGWPIALNLPELTPAAQALRLPRSCYDHLAGELAVAVAATLEKRGYLVRGEGKRYEIGGRSARRWFVKQGIDLDGLQPGRWGIARQCLDWTEREPHVAGPLGSRLFSAWTERGWLKRQEGNSRVVKLTALGRKRLQGELDLSGEVFHQ